MVGQSDWENQDIRLKTPFFLSKSKRESLDKIKRAGECMICARKTPTSPNDDLCTKRPPRLFSKQALSVSCQHEQWLTRSCDIEHAWELPLRLPCPSSPDEKALFPNSTSIQGDEGVDIKELRSKLKGKSKEEILEAVKQDGALTFHVYEKTNYNPVLKWHQHKSSEEIAKKLSRNGDEYLASLHEMIGPI